MSENVNISEWERISNKRFVIEYSFLNSFYALYQ